MDPLTLTLSGVLARLTWTVFHRKSEAAIRLRESNPHLAEAQIDLLASKERAQFYGFDRLVERQTKPASMLVTRTWRDAFWFCMALVGIITGSVGVLIVGLIIALSPLWILWLLSLTLKG